MAAMHVGICLLLGVLVWLFLKGTKKLRKKTAVPQDVYKRQLDVHRDAIERENGTRCAPVCTIDGRQAAQVMKMCIRDRSVTEAEEDMRFKCINSITRIKEPVWERVFSAKVFNDSKKFKNCYRDVYKRQVQVFI